MGDAKMLFKLTQKQCHGLAGCSNSRTELIMRFCYESLNYKIL